MKKLTLKKEIVASLSSVDALGINGGSGDTCFSGFSEWPAPCNTECPVYCIYTQGCIPTQTDCC